MHLRHLLRETLRRAEAKTKDHNPSLAAAVGEDSGAGERVLAHLFPQQRALVHDKSKKRAARCGRRAGKTTTAAASMVRRCLNRAGGLCAYITITRAQAKRLIWRELKRLNTHYGLGMTFSESDLVVTFPNSSQIYVAGCDKQQEIEKWRGVAFLEVIVDECASIKAHLESLIREVIEPTLEDYDGCVTMLGTPSRACAGMFFDATTKAPGWSRHHWTVLDNSEFPRWKGKRNWRELAKKWIERLETDDYPANEDEEQDPVFLREWLGRWVRDVGSLVYKYTPAKNDDAELPGGEWFRILGIDLGSNDASAFVVIAYSKSRREAFVEHAEKESGLDVVDVAERIKALRTRFGGFRSMVIDSGGLGKMVAETLKRKHQLPVKPAEKTHKAAFQADLNADLRKGWLKVLPAAKPLVDEWTLLQLDEDGEEDDRFENHCSDAALYGYRESRHYCYKPKAERPPKGSPEALEREAEEMERGDTADLEEPDETDQLWS